MMKVYALLIRKWMDELQEYQWDGTIEHFEKQERKQQEYTYKMNKLYNRLKREYGFDKEKFYALQDQAVMM
ncbi:Uncharacterised protein [[Flavobacterium] thermophilum]|nr:Uncharacterised protein [[Flavobacterium] thermophilum]